MANKKGKMREIWLESDRQSQQKFDFGLFYQFCNNIAKLNIAYKLYSNIILCILSSTLFSRN